MSAVKKKRETCEEQLRRMCRNIADSITNPVMVTDEETKSVQEDLNIFMENVYDIEWITHNDHSYKAARLLVAGGGPNIWVNLLGNTVDGYWWGDHCKVPFSDNLGLDDYLEELHAC
jgi:hypothetical protein